ncbi:hypothetical protein CDD81_4103 [Ophiocordyceps australis]|uniref:Nucleoside transporter FUN26 n=1 Tax=Ophiocordyceps australis TaxID=1399860 RepID=A0A2C5YBN1_9HYPO|nr:hypothetical protein CDD81_4103 [Ophiocordyceps australis]
MESRPSPAADYEPIPSADVDQDSSPRRPSASRSQHQIPFSWLEYSIFCFLGIAMLWAWNMFLAAAPYFASRFADNAWIHANFQSAILTISTLTNLAAMLLLTHVQRNASYPFRINLALMMNAVIFSLLTASTALFLNSGPGSYFAFVLVIVACASWATGLLQNGAFAFAGSFGRPEYMQAVMAGQGIAGVLPSIAQVAAVLIFPPLQRDHTDAGPPPGGKENGAQRAEKSAFVYFLAAVVISVAALLALIPLVQRHKRIVASRAAAYAADAATELQDAQPAPRKRVALRHLFGKLRWLALGIALTFAVTMFFPVFTAKIFSIRDAAHATPIYRPAAFVPLAFTFWNVGDLGGRIISVMPTPVDQRPLVLFLLAICRTAHLPLYLLCNIGGRGAVVKSDWFYLIVVQLFMGLTNGWLGSTIMMAAGDWVDQSEREASGSFMGLFLVIGLSAGSLLSFSVAGV